MSLTVVGVDTAANRLHAVSSAWTFTYSYGPIEDEPNPDVRRHDLFKAAKSLYALLEPGTHVFCEEPLALRNGKTTRLLALAAGAIWAAHLEYDLFWHWADVAAWKKQVVGKGNASKEEIQAWAEKQGWRHYKDEDLTDAACIAKFGAIQLAEAGTGLSP